MRQFTRVYRLFLLLLTICLGGSLWVAAQETTDAPTGPNPSAPALTFWLDKIPLFNREMPEGIPLWQYAASFIYILLAFAVAKILDMIARVYLRRWASGTKTKLDNLILDLMHGPVRVISFAILFYIGLEVFVWPDYIENILLKVLTVVVACSVTYCAVRVVDLFVNHWREKAGQDGEKTFDEHLFPVIRKALQAFIIVVAVLVTSHNLGLNITGLIASLSIGGLALGLAAQDTLANLFGAISVFLDKPFRIGDRIKLDAIDGTVEAIGLRSTRVRNLDGHLITVPNKTMGNATITNITRRPNIKTVMNIGVTYDTPVEKVNEALKILEEVYRAHSMTFDVWISFNQFAESSLNILVIHWWNGTVYKEYLGGIQEMNLSVKARFDAARISFAFPTRTLYVKQDSDWRVNEVSGGNGAGREKLESKGGAPLLR